MPEIISNSSCLIALDNIGMLFVLKELYGTIHIREEVFEEFGKTRRKLDTGQFRSK